MRKNEGLMKMVVVTIVLFALTSVALSVGAAITPEEKCVSAWSDIDGIARSTNFNIPAGWVGTDVRRHVDTTFMPIEPGAGHTDRVGCQLTGPVNWKGGVTWSGETYGPAAPKTLPAGIYTFNMERHGKLDTCRLCYTLKPVPAVTPEEKCVSAWSDSDGIAQSTNFNIPAGWVGTDVRRHVDTTFMPIEPGAGHTDRVGCQLTGPVNWKGGVTWSGETYGPAAPKTLPAGIYTFNMERHGKLDTCRLCYTLKRGATPNLTQQRLYPVADGEVYAYSYRNWNWANWGRLERMGAGWHPVGGEKRAYLRFDLPAGLDAITPEEKCVSASADSDGIAQSTNFNIPAGWVGTDVRRHVDTSFMPIEPGAGHTDRVGCQLTGPVIGNTTFNWIGGVTWSGEKYGPAAPKTLPAGIYTFNMERHGKLDTCRLCYTLKPVPYVPYNNSRAYVLKLYQYHSSGPVHTLGVYRVTSSWEEGTDTYHSGKVEETAAPGELCWMQQPSFDPVPVATFTSATAVPAWVEVNITSLVQQWQSGTPNYGLVIKTTNENPTRSDPVAVSGFLTKDDPDHATHPVLELSLSGTAPLPTPSKPPLKQTVCASAKPSFTSGGKFTPATFTIGGTEPQKVSITSHADNFAIMAIPGMRIVYRVTAGKSSGSLTLVPGTYRLSCGGGGVMGLESATVCIEYPVVTGTPPAPTP